MYNINLYYTAIMCVLLTNYSQGPVYLQDNSTNIIDTFNLAIIRIENKIVLESENASNAQMHAVYDLNYYTISEKSGTANKYDKHGKRINTYIFNRQDERSLHCIEFTRNGTLIACSNNYIYIIKNDIMSVINNYFRIMMLSACENKLVTIDRTKKSSFLYFDENFKIVGQVTGPIPMDLPKEGLRQMSFVRADDNWILVAHRMFAGIQIFNRNGELLRSVSIPYSSVREKANVQLLRGGRGRGALTLVDIFLVNSTIYVLIPNGRSAPILATYRFINDSWEFSVLDTGSPDNSIRSWWAQSRGSSLSLSALVIENGTKAFIYNYSIPFK